MKNCAFRWALLSVAYAPRRMASVKALLKVPTFTAARWASRWVAPVSSFGFGGLELNWDLLWKRFFCLTDGFISKISKCSLRPSESESLYRFRKQLLLGHAERFYTALISWFHGRI